MLEILDDNKERNFNNADSFKNFLLLSSFWVGLSYRIKLLSN